MKRIVGTILICLAFSGSVNAKLNYDNLAEEELPTYCSDWAASVAFQSQYLHGTEYWSTYFAAYNHCVEQTY